MESFTVGIDTYLIPSSTDDGNTDQLTTVVYRYMHMRYNWLEQGFLTGAPQKQFGVGLWTIL